MRRSLRHRSIVKRILQIAGILFLVQSIVDYRRSRAPYLGEVGAPDGQKIFIASIHWNNEKILRSHWVPGVLGLVDHFGKDNVYVSVQESGSWDDSKGALRELDQSLEQAGVRRRIILDETTHEDEIKKLPAENGWIQTSRGAKELRRVPYLARLRNLVLKPLQELAEAGEHFDKILFLNDVVFTVCTSSHITHPGLLCNTADVHAPRQKTCNAFSRPVEVTMQRLARLTSPSRQPSTTPLPCETQKVMPP
jgi:hypothetical protein